MGSERVEMSVAVARSELVGGGEVSCGSSVSGVSEGTMLSGPCVSTSVIVKQRCF